jgi:hypothetical protein
MPIRGLFDKKSGASRQIGGSITSVHKEKTVKRALWADSQMGLCYGKSNKPKSPKEDQPYYTESIRCIGLLWKEPKDAK